MAAHGDRVASLGEVQPAELHLDGAWRAAEVLGWRFDDDGRCRARVRVDWAGTPRVVWAPLELLRLPEAAPPSAVRSAPADVAAPAPADVVVPLPRDAVPPPALPAPHRAAAALPRPRRQPDPGRWTGGVLAGGRTGGHGPRPETWREDHPYPELLRRREYEIEKRRLQIELLKLQGWVKDTGQRLVIVFEGRDAAGKGGAIKRFTEHLNPRGARTVALDKPSEREQNQWYFQRYVQHLPAAGEIVLFDRSWYNRAGVERVMGYCTDEEYAAFLREAPEFERMLVADGVHLVKLWFSVSRGEQRTRFAIRQRDPVRQWKLSPTDLAALDRWDDYTAAKEAMFAATSTPHAPWTVVRANDKKRARLEAMRHVLSVLDYTGRRGDVVGTPDPLVVVPAGAGEALRPTGSPVAASR
ncbi:polyphosphate kinase 2 [Geodermatophilus sp. FMUSA9-8]|uniref:polyphosphate kinase 2 n=1 Tax=Geodermatophilus sp. FMUSA9-8 TaxID=3120155 RepID=UPI0030081B10